MRIDGHVHISDGPVDRARLESDLRSAGFAGACLISRPPVWLRDGQWIHRPASERLAEILRWTGGNPELHPLFWIDPTEGDAEQQVADAVRGGIAGFKTICSAHEPGDPRAMPVYRAIAAARKPLLFHSGILWDGRPSSGFNRPAAFEALLDVPGLVFSLAHMSWPWLDECVAVYGKFLNARRMRPDAPEMFIDTTPGTPPIYREEALTKLFRIGYDVGDNVIFGTDGSSLGYNSAWAREWQERDEAIMRKLGLGEDAIGKVMGDNLRRWLGGKTFSRRAPVPGERLK